MTAISAATSAAPIFVAAPDIASPPRRDEWEAYLSRHGKSFWLAARLIPPRERAQLAGVYAWCRYTDDLVDHARCSWGDLLRVLGEWKALSRAAYEGNETGIELLDVVMGDMARCDVPFTYASNLIRGMRADVVGARYDTLGDLIGYCQDVASVVGLWTTELFGVHDRWTLDRAAMLGVAMQLTNIARDVGEDWERGRMYLPQSLLERYGVTEQMIGETRRGGVPLPAGYAELLGELMAIAETRYDEAGEAVANLPAFLRPSVAIASRVYRGIHDVIRANGFDSIRHRAVVPNSTRMSLASAALAALAALGERQV
jgi:15-cis-phytoene synthase